MNGIELEADAGAFLAHLTPDQLQRFDALDAAYIGLLSQAVPDRADIAAHAGDVVAFFDGLVDSDVGSEKRGRLPRCPLSNGFKWPVQCF